MLTYVLKPEMTDISATSDLQHNTDWRIFLGNSWTKPIIQVEIDQLSLESHPIFI